jgi:putative Mg2+ transporter-C (MgtC) family protein
VLYDLDTEVAVKLLLATVLGGLIGLEREVKQKPAGLRTIMFICIGSTMFTLLSEKMGQRFGGDPLRIASQLIPGIGFLGAGAILREGGSVIGLTTAAIIFITASIGMALGAGFYATAIASALLILFLLFAAGWAESRFNSRAAGDEHSKSR